MTTHLPYPPPQQPPAPAYPTAPPWATPTPAAAPAATAAPPATTPWGAPYTAHGQLLVPYPEEMQNAARAEPPPWWPVVAWTAVFGLLGAISAARRGGQARRGRNSAAPYWIAFGATLVVGSILSAMVVAVAVPVYLAQREHAITRTVQERVVQDGRVEAAMHSAATTATCDPVGDRVGGIRRYSCVVSLADGRSATLAVEAGDDGRWSPVTR